MDQIPSRIIADLLAGQNHGVNVITYENPIEFSFPANAMADVGRDSDVQAFVGKTESGKTTNFTTLFDGVDRRTVDLSGAAKTYGQASSFEELFGLLSDESAIAEVTDPDEYVLPGDWFGSHQGGNGRPATMTRALSLSLIDDPRLEAAKPATVPSSTAARSADSAVRAFVKDELYTVALSELYTVDSSEPTPTSATWRTPSERRAAFESSINCILRSDPAVVMIDETVRNASKIASIGDPPSLVGMSIGERSKDVVARLLNERSKTNPIASISDPPAFVSGSAPNSATGNRDIIWT